MTTQPRLFHLQRDHDISGVSGTGRIADGVLWPDGTVALRWIGDRPSTVHWERLSDAVAIHGHDGATRIVWADEQPPVDRAAALALTDKLIEHCPDHGCVEPEWEDGCHCEIVPLLRRMADEAPGGAR
ncbi:hypothetical protein ACIQMV_18885 [Streptomyces sp. NPDC091412]|uniref:hypothetical protein n=1 Tax=Streptomyces sp. NPDC091412 TaxID=3366002 RepID=UPI00382C57EA